MVALASPPSETRAPALPGRRGRAWDIGAAVALGVGIGVRLVLGAGGTGDRSAAVMAALLIGGAWITARLLATPRMAFLVALGLVVAFDLAVFSPRFEPAYDSREAFYRPDQVLTAHAQVGPGIERGSGALLTLLVEPVFPAGASQPRFSLAGDVGGVPLEWDCAFSRGRHQIALPVPSTAVSGAAAVDVHVHLTGSPSRETDYLLAYASSARGGFLAALVRVRQADLEAGATVCTAR